MATVERTKVAPRGRDCRPGGKIFLVDIDSDVLAETDSMDWVDWVHHGTALQFQCHGPPTSAGAVLTSVRAHAVVDDWGCTLVDFKGMAPIWITIGDTFTLKTPY